MSRDSARRPGAVHRRRPLAAVLRRAAAAIALVLVIAGGLTEVAHPAASARERTSSDVDGLWRTYPLEQTTTTSAPTQDQRSTGSPTGAARPSGEGDEPRAASGDAPTAAIVAGAGAVLLLGMLLVRSRRAPSARRLRGADPRAIVPTASRTPTRTLARGDAQQAGHLRPTPAKADPAVPPTAASPSNGRRDARALPHEPRVPVGPEVGAAGTEGASSPRFERDTAGVEPARKSTAAAQRGPVCQIRWSARARRPCFEAFVVDADGVERRVARSPRLDPPVSSPPERTPEAQAALRTLAKELRDDGWKPLRAKGKDFGEQQWYTRRFRQPVELEDDAPAEPGPTGAGRNVGRP
jgi:hypothetical protein